MEEGRKGAKKIATLRASLIKEARINIILFLLAGLIMGLGIYLRYHPEWTLRVDIIDYNQGVSDYRAPTSKEPNGPSLSSLKGLPSVYSVERARINFEKASLESTDKKLKALALYNLGTIAGRLAFDERLLSKRRIEMAEASNKLAEAIRIDPNNEDAKFNKELLDRVQAQEGKGKGEPGPGYSPGVVEKGF